MNKKQIDALVRRHYGFQSLRYLERFVQLLLFVGMLASGGLACVALMGNSSEQYAAGAFAFWLCAVSGDEFERRRIPVRRAVLQWGIPHTWLDDWWYYVEKIELDRGELLRGSSFCVHARILRCIHRQDVIEWVLDSRVTKIQVMMPRVTPEQLGISQGCVIQRNDGVGIERSKTPLCVAKIGLVNCQ